MFLFWSRADTRNALLALAIIVGMVLTIAISSAPSAAGDRKDDTMVDPLQGVDFEKGISRQQYEQLRRWAHVGANIHNHVHAITGGNFDADTIAPRELAKDDANADRIAICRNVLTILEFNNLEAVRAAHGDAPAPPRRAVVPSPAPAATPAATPPSIRGSDYYWKRVREQAGKIHGDIRAEPYSEEEGDVPPEEARRLLREKGELP
jgi:hypothetical protein